MKKGPPGAFVVAVLVTLSAAGCDDLFVSKESEYRNGVSGPVNVEAVVALLRR